MLVKCSWKDSSLYLIYALLSRIKLCRDNALFGGHFWPKFDGRGHPGSINQQPRQPWLGDQRNLGGPKGVTALRCIFKGEGQKGVIVSLKT